MIYKAIFFDWDGTAVTSRKAPVEEVCKRMEKLLNRGVKLFIISGTTYENIGGGKLHEILKDADLDNLYLGLGRGVHNIGFKNGKPVYLQDNTPSLEEKLKLDGVCFDVHKFLYQKYEFPTDIVFSRPNYCKIDIMVAHNRGDQLFLQENEIEQVNQLIKSYKIEGGLLELVHLANQIGERKSLEVVTTTDAKYLEIGLTTKSDNVNFMVDNVLNVEGISLKDCSFWGDEFTYLCEGILGSDGFMITTKTKEGEFFDVSQKCISLPQEVMHVGGGVHRFLAFLDEQVKERE